MGNGDGIGIPPLGNNLLAGEGLCKISPLFFLGDLIHKILHVFCCHCDFHGGCNVGISPIIISPYDFFHAESDLLGPYRVGYAKVIADEGINKGNIGGMEIPRKGSQQKKGIKDKYDGSKS